MFFKKFLEELNDNSKEVKFSGDAFFQFHESTFTVFDVNQEEMTLTEIDYTPVSEEPPQFQQYRDQNKRQDWNRNFVMPVKINSLEKFDEDNAVYSALIEVVERLNGSVIEDNGRRYDMKVFTPVKQSMPFLHRGYWFILLGVQVNTTSLVQGVFGNEWKLTIEGENSGEMDIEDFTITAGVESADDDDQSQETDTVFRPYRKAHTFQMVAYHLNRDIDRELEEMVFDENYKKRITLKWERDNQEKVYEVSMENGVIEYSKGVPVMHNFTFKKRE